MFLAWLLEKDSNVEQVLSNRSMAAEAEESFFSVSILELMSSELVEAADCQEAISAWDKLSIEGV